MFGTRACFFVICIFLLAPDLFVNCQHTCDTGKYLRDCGHYGIQQQQCEEQNCCWNPNVPPGQPWCFNKNGGYKYCSNDKTRIDCGVYGTKEDECLRRGCCWDPVGENSVNAWCFFPNTNYEVNRCPYNKRVPCGGEGMTRNSCETLECCWSPKENCPLQPSCFLSYNQLNQKASQIVYFDSAASSAKTEL